MKEQVFGFRKKEGKVNIYRKADMKNTVNNLPDGEYEWVLRKKKKKASAEQSGFYFDCYIQEEIDCFKEYWGETYSKKEVHEWNKANLWADEKIVGDEIVKSPGTSSDKSTVEWEDKLERGRQWFRLTFNWEISYPDHQKSIKFKKYGV